MKNKALQRILFVSALAYVSSLVLAGCDNVGDENPISPDRMEQIRKQEGDQRSNFKPQGGPPPGGATTGR